MSKEQVALSLSSAFLFRTCAGTSHEASVGECRHDCDDEESHKEDLVDGDHVHADHDDNCSASGSGD